MTFKPSDDGILRVLYRERMGDNFVDVGEDFELERTIDSQQVNIEVLYVFFPNTAGNCRIFLEGNGGGGQFENQPSATDHPGLPEHRTYRFIPK
ncbi:MAG: hypothetical protein ACR2J3_00370 [Aridibacter sp.]